MQYFNRCTSDGVSPLHQRGKGHGNGRLDASIPAQLTDLAHHPIKEHPVGSSLIFEKRSQYRSRRVKTRTRLWSTVFARHIRRHRRAGTHNGVNVIGRIVGVVRIHSHRQEAPTLRM